VAYLEIGQGGGHIKRVWGTESSSAGFNSRALLGAMGRSPRSSAISGIYTESCACHSIV